MLETYFDSITDGPGCWKWTHYFPVYERYFAKFVDTEVNLLEVGVFGGGSLPMWRHYLGDRCHVYGVDIDPACLKHANDHTTIIIGDQADPQFWRDTLADIPPLHIVIDDGGHQTHQQLRTLEACLPHLAPGGVYIVEDLYTPDNKFLDYLDGFSRRLHDYTPIESTNPLVPPQHTLSVNEWQQTIDSVHLHPFMAVIETRQEPLTQMTAPRHGSEWL